jgi:hypothetical protein
VQDPRAWDNTYFVGGASGSQAKLEVLEVQEESGIEGADIAQGFSPD